MRHLALLVLISTSVWAAEPAKEKPVINPAPSAQDWANLAKLPDWSGVWNPKITDQEQQARTNPPPWNEKGTKEVHKMWAEEKVRRPKLILYGCLPDAHPSWLIDSTHTMLSLFSPIRVTH